MRRITVGLITTALVVSGALPAQAGVKVIGKASASGDYAIALASGNVDEPLTIWAKVVAKPRQHVDAYWTMVCSKGSGAGSKSGDFSGTTPIRRALKMPYVAPDSCTVSTSAQLDDSGKITVILLAEI